MNKLFERLGDVLRAGGDAVLVTVIASSGSTPRGAGACMLVTAGGRQCGTIGGGAVEFECERMAQDVLRDKISRTESYRLRENQVRDLGMICGGDVHVHFRYIPAGDADVLALTRHVLRMFERNEECWLLNEITEGQAGAIGLYSKDSGAVGVELPGDAVSSLRSRPQQIDVDGRRFYCEKLVQAGVVYIFGGGHVSQALVPVLSAVRFHCVVLEDREEFCRPALFPGVRETRLLDKALILDAVDIGEDDYVVIMTRGHKDDLNVQAQVLNTPAHYIGVIGSRRKAAGVFASLRAMGFTDRDLARITTPIGLDIQAETPEEIAVSIAAQMIQVRAQRWINHGASPDAPVIADQAL